MPLTYVYDTLTNQLEYRPAQALKSDENFDQNHPRVGADRH